jgi:hypothetical protein
MNSSLTPKGMESRTWNGVEIQRRPSDGYVNATAMCKAYGKLFNDYRRLDRTTQYIAALERSMAETDCGAAVTGFPVTGKPDLVQTIQGGLPHLQGTWVHPRIAVDLARWLHPEFAVMMDGWFLESFTPKIAADATPAPAPLPKRPRQREVWEVGGPGVVVPGGALLSAQLTVVLDAYTAHMEAEHEMLRFPECRPFRSPRAATKRFLEWFATTHGKICHGQLALSSTGLPVASVAAPSRPPAPSRPAPAVPGPAPRPSRYHQALQAPFAPQSPPAQAPQHDGYRPGDLITGPDLSHLLGLEPKTINKWAADRSIGAERDGWRLIGRGKLSAGKQCAVYPPGCASWLFQKL